jgi:predicted glycosyl hydrolase (DUF1957 family)
MKKIYNKKLSAIVMLYSNLQYSEIPESKIPELIKKSYEPMFDLLLKRKKTIVLLGMTGRSMEILKELNKPVFKKLQKLVRDKKVFIVGGTYTNAILPLLSEEGRIRQIKKQYEIVKKYFGVLPIGFCPPEFCWSPILSETLKKFNVDWSIIPEHLIYFSKTLNESAVLKPKHQNYSAEIGANILNRSWVRKIVNFPKIVYLFHKELRNINHRSFYIDGTNSEIIGIPNNRSWTGFVNMALRNFALQNETKLQNYLLNQKNNGTGFFMPFLGDIENVGYGGNSPVVISIKDFERFLNLFERTGFKIETPSQYIKDLKIDSKIYIKSGTGEPSGRFDMWTSDPDNIVLNKMCDEIQMRLRSVKNSPRKKLIEKYLMLAENADGRAWNPLPERRLACFKSAEKAIELLK